METNVAGPPGTGKSYGEFTSNFFQLQKLGCILLIGTVFNISWDMLLILHTIVSDSYTSRDEMGWKQI